MVARNGSLRLPAGRARQDYRPSVGRRALQPAACAFGRGAGWRGGPSRGGVGPWRRGRRAAGCRRYDDILPHPPCRGRVRFAYPPGGYGRIWDCQAGGEPYGLRLRSGRRPARGAAGTPVVRAGVWGGGGGFWGEVFTGPLGRGSETAGFRLYDEILARARPAGVSSVKPSCQWHDGSEKRCASLTRRAGAAGFGTVRRAESPIACACAPAIGPRDVPPARRKVRAGCGPAGVGPRG
jgi:hypothetical protein